MPLEIVEEVDLKSSILSPWEETVVETTHQHIVPPPSPKEEEVINISNDTPKLPNSVLDNQV